MNKIFPSVPKRIEDLTLEQKKLLVDEGAAEIAFALGLVPEVIASEDWFLNRVATSLTYSPYGNSRTRELGADFVFRKREIEALVRIDKFFDEHRDRPRRAVLIYGDEHRFAQRYRSDSIRIEKSTP